MGFLHPGDLSLSEWLAIAGFWIGGPLLLVGLAVRLYRLEKSEANRRKQ